MKPETERYCVKGFRTMFGTTSKALSSVTISSPKMIADAAIRLSK